MVFVSCSLSSIWTLAHKSFCFAKSARGHHICFADMILVVIRISRISENIDRSVVIPDMVREVCHCINIPVIRMVIFRPVKFRYYLAVSLICSGYRCLYSKRFQCLLKISCGCCNLLFSVFTRICHCDKDICAFCFFNAHC